MIHSFAIGYIYSFVAAGVFYYALMRFFPHNESRLDYPITGEDIVAANDEKQIAAGHRKHQRSMLDFVRGRKPRQASV